MSEPQSYPSPNAAQMAAGAAGLYAHPNGNMSPGEQPSAVDPHLSLAQQEHTLQQELAAQLSRATEAPMTAGQSQQQHGMPVAHHLAQVHASMQQPSTPQQMAQNAMSMAQDVHYGNHPDSNQRKRSKVSRACDECRRKKIRCDATSENGPEACTSCKRTGARCQFSRQPMKRGPSKGYIKELADRLSRLEYEQQQLGHSPQSGQQTQQHPDLQYLQPLSEQSMASLQDFSSSATAQFGNGRKRTHSMSEGLSDHQFRTSMSQPPNGAQQPWDRRESFTGYEHDPAGAFFEFSQTAELAVNEYYRVIQDTYPVLPFDLRNLKGRLANCESKLRDGFIAALDCVVRVWPSANLPLEQNHKDNCYRAYEMLTSYVGTPLPKDAGIILTQSFILLAIESDVHSPAHVQGFTPQDVQVGSLKNMCIGQAARIAGGLSLNAMIYRQRGEEISPDNDESLGRRIFWILFILDQLHAVSTSSEPSISDERNHLTLEDEVPFGSVTFALARLCKVLAHVSDHAKIAKDADPITNDIMSLHNQVSTVLKFSKKTILGELERFHEALDPEAHPLILLAYWHVRLLVVRFSPWSEPGEILSAATTIVEILQSHSVFVTSPYHHFAALAALTLGELTEKDETRDEALRFLGGELEATLARTKDEGYFGWDTVIREYAMKKRSSVVESNGGASTNMLDHLAEAAMGERRESTSKAGDKRPVSSGNAEPKDDISNAAAAAAAAATAAAALNQSLHFNPAALVRDGYLNVLAQVMSLEQ